MATLKQQSTVDRAFVQLPLHQNGVVPLASANGQANGDGEDSQIHEQESEASPVVQTNGWPSMNAQEIRRLEQELAAAGAMSKEEIEQRGHTQLPASHQMSLVEFLQSQD